MNRGANVASGSSSRGRSCYSCNEANRDSAESRTFERFLVLALIWICVVLPRNARAVGSQSCCESVDCVSIKLGNVHFGSSSIASVQLRSGETDVLCTVVGQRRGVALSFDIFALALRRARAFSWWRQVLWVHGAGVELAWRSAPHRDPHARGRTHRQTLACSVKSVAARWAASPLQETRGSDG
ncbi:hypothetical protein BJV74DRAFT_496704 [Russula compacta]|nr:hypothetical protein BJV74DRAFT_496704 [Russula compacta]